MKKPTPLNPQLFAALNSGRRRSACRPDPDLVALLLKLDLAGFLQVYTAIYVVSALLYLWLAIRWPLSVK